MSVSWADRRALLQTVSKRRETDKPLYLRQKLTAVFTVFAFLRNFCAGRGGLSQLQVVPE
jgi:hypothetical protein